MAKDNTDFYYLTVLQVRSLEMHLKVLAGLCSFLEALGENLVFCLFQLLEVAHIPWLVAPSSSRPARTGLSHEASLCLPCPHLKNPLLILSSVGQQPNPICNLNSPLPGNTVFPGIRV